MKTAMTSLKYQSISRTLSDREILKNFHQHTHYDLFLLLITSGRHSATVVYPITAASIVTQVTNIYVAR